MIYMRDVKKNLAMSKFYCQINDCETLHVLEKEICVRPKYSLDL